ncbi:MAG: hypothetical protein AB1679_00275 [Actinomycetota bacterium]
MELVLTDKEHTVLERLVSRRKSTQAMASRARIMLRCASGLAPPIHFQHEPARPDLRPPGLGEHTQQILDSAPAAASAGSERT